MEGWRADGLTAGANGAGGRGLVSLAGRVARASAPFGPTRH